MLDRAVWIKEFAARCAHRWIRRQDLGERFQPAWLGNCIIVEKKEQIRLGGSRALIARMGKAHVFFIKDRPQTPGGLLLAEKLARAIGRSIIHDHDFMSRGRGASDGCQALLGQFEVVEGGNDDRSN